MVENMITDRNMFEIKLAESEHKVINGAALSVLSKIMIKEKQTVYKSNQLNNLNIIKIKNQKAIEVLNSLITINNDRIEGYETASKGTKELDLKPYLHNSCQPIKNANKN